MKKTPLLALFAVLMVPPIGNLDARDAPPLTDSQIRQHIIQDSVAAYLATGHSCACPYNSACNGIELRRAQRLQQARWCTSRFAILRMSPMGWCRIGSANTQANDHHGAGW
jgi:hypothetical protein